MALSEITGDAVRRAIAEFDALGEAAFLRRYGFRRAVSYHLQHDGKLYPSKAIAGAAHGFAMPNVGPLRARDFSGGDATVATVLRDLGFTILVSTASTAADARHEKLVERSPEMMLAAYYLARCGALEKGKASKPPAALGVDTWSAAYDVFFDEMGGGRSLGQFRNSLKNARDTFDTLFDNGRVGWKDAEGRQPELSGRFARIHDEWRGRSDLELEDVVLRLAGGRGGEESDDVGVAPTFARTEGGQRVYVSKRRERDPALRGAALEFHGLDCMVCGFNFAEAYGVYGAGFAEVHHMVPLSETGPTETDPTTDLSVVCANCHRMLHRKRGECLTLEALRRMLIG